MLLLCRNHSKFYVAPLLLMESSLNPSFESSIICRTTTTFYVFACLIFPQPDVGPSYTESIKPAEIY